MSSSHAPNESARSVPSDDKTKSLRTIPAVTSTGPPMSEVEYSRLPQVPPHLSRNHIETLAEKVESEIKGKIGTIVRSVLYENLSPGNANLRSRSPGSSLGLASAAQPHANFAPAPDSDFCHGNLFDEPAREAAYKQASSPLSYDQRFREAGPAALPSAPHAAAGLVDKQTFNFVPASGLRSQGAGSVVQLTPCATAEPPNGQALGPPYSFDQYFQGTGSTIVQSALPTPAGPVNTQASNPFLTCNPCFQEAGPVVQPIPYATAEPPNGQALGPPYSFDHYVQETGSIVVQPASPALANTQPSISSVVTHSRAAGRAKRRNSQEQKFWEEHKKKLRELYVTDDLPLKQVMEKMKEVSDFQPTEKQFRYQFGVIWGWRKYGLLGRGMK
ncbi:hypothetical protein F5Y10DRAFT_131455 [Nemania abortiva]|nr:hypothetical protein F5Y10DRAFT_131455 [Nemania abortiva]